MGHSASGNLRKSGPPYHLLPGPRSTRFFPSNPNFYVICTFSKYPLGGCSWFLISPSLRATNVLNPCNSFCIKPFIVSELTMQYFSLKLYLISFFSISSVIRSFKSITEKYQRWPTSCVFGSQVSLKFHTFHLK